MNEGVFRVLRALGDGQAWSRSTLIRRAGEAHSVVADLEKKKAKWFEQSGSELKLSTLGLAAYAREQHARLSVAEALTEGSEHAATHTDDAPSLAARFAAIAARRPSPKRELDQVHATPAASLRRARLLAERGEHQRGVLFLGDDDLASVAVALALADEELTRTIHTLDLDPELVELFQGLPLLLDASLHDLREPLPRELRGRFGAVVSDPPYAPEGFALFLSRALSALKPDGTLYLHFGGSRRASERVLQKQKIVGEHGLLITEVVPDFMRYEGAESIGSKSSLWICQMTPQARPLPEERLTASELYTRRAPTESTEA